MLALRTRRGLDAGQVARAGDAVDDLVALGLVDETADGGVVLTRAGRLLANEVAARLLEACDRLPARVLRHHAEAGTR